MSATVTLKVVHGPLCGAEFAYRLPTLCTMGRSSDCSLRMPNDFPNRSVSRHHCLLEIDPPLVRVCDLDSMNGTFINGELIGKRESPDRPPEGRPPLMPDRALADGDELRVGENVFRVSVCVEKGDGGRAPGAPACKAVCRADRQPGETAGRAC
jgi:hypothetical protein